MPFTGKRHCTRLMLGERPEKFPRVTTLATQPLELANGLHDGNGKSRSAAGEAGGPRSGTAGRRGGFGHSRALAYMQCDDTGARERCTL